jgi:hypothetical protein
VKAPPVDAKPYGWFIEYPMDAKPADRLVTFLANNGDRDRGYADDYASRLHGVVVTAIADRRAP